MTSFVRDVKWMYGAQRKNSVEEKQMRVYRSLIWLLIDGLKLVFSSVICKMWLLPHSQEYCMVSYNKIKVNIVKTILTY